MITSNPDFSKAYIAANELLATGKELDIFPFLIKPFIKANTDVTLCSFEKAQSKYNANIRAWGSESAVLQEYQGQSIIFYNKEKTGNHIRFSCCHELGHYILGHKMNLDPNSDLYKKQEIETNYFAAQLLMPEQILIECRKRSKSITPDFLINHFEVSPIAADKRLTTLSKIQPEWRRNIEKEYDDIILLRFAKFIDSIAPKHIDYLFSDEEERQRERDTWYYKGYRRGDYYD